MRITPLKSSRSLVYFLLLLTFLLLSPENITAQEPLYRDPEVVQKELAEKLVIKDEDIAKYPGEVRSYTERGEIYGGLCILSRNDKEKAAYAERAAADFAKAIELDPNLSYLNRHLSNPEEIHCPQPFLVRAKLYRQLGKITLALADEKTASKLPVPPMTCEAVEEDWK